MTDEPKDKNSRYEKYLKRQEAAKTKTEKDELIKLGKIIGWDINKNEAVRETLEN